MNYLSTVVALCILQNFALGYDEDYTDEEPTLNAKQWRAEVNAGSKADLMENRQYFYPEHYKDLSRRFVPVYPYKETSQSQKADDQDPKLIPVRAPPELVLAVAKQSAKLQLNPSKPTEEVFRNYILRSGDYWNGVWKEDIDPSTQLRTTNENKSASESVQVKIMPTSKLYDLISALQKMSPRLLYIINENNKVD